MKEYSRKDTSKKVTVTFSLPADLNHKLHVFVERRGLSAFVTKAIKKSLYDEQEVLKVIYAAAIKFVLWINHD